MTPARLWRRHVRIAATSAAHAARHPSRILAAGYILAPLIVLGYVIRWVASWQPETRLTLAGWAVVLSVLVGLLSRSQGDAPPFADELDGHSPRHLTGGKR